MTKILLMVMSNFLKHSNFTKNLAPQIELTDFLGQDAYNLPPLINPTNIAGGGVGSC